MASFAIVELRLEDMLRNCSSAVIVSGRRRGHDHSKDACRQYEMETAELHDLASAAFVWFKRANAPKASIITDSTTCENSGLP